MGFTNDTARQEKREQTNKHKISSVKAQSKSQKKGPRQNPSRFTSAIVGFQSVSPRKKNKNLTNVHPFLRLSSQPIQNSSSLLL